MRRTTVIVGALAAAVALAACSSGSGGSSPRGADPQPSGSAAAVVAGAGRLTAGSRTMDVVLGSAIPVAGSAGTRALGPPTNTR